MAVIWRDDVGYCNTFPTKGDDRGKTIEAFMRAAAESIMKKASHTVHFDFPIRYNGTIVPGKEARTNPKNQTNSETDGTAIASEFRFRYI